MKHLAKKTPNGAQLNLDALYQIVPSCFTEAKDENGEIHRVVDFNKLRLLLGDDAVEDAPEVYDFTWVGKRAALQEAAAPINKTLRPCPEESVDWDKTKNLYIEGDNLEVLKLLQNSYMGKIKMIYIDPPYNTGNDFVYHDDFAQSADEYDENNRDEEGNRYRKNTDSNGRFHSDWCSMMYSRLLLCRSLLRNDGAIFISISDAELDNLKKICDEVFGGSNYLGDIIWNSTKSVTNTAIISVSHTYNLVYFKDMNYFVEHRSEFRLPDDGEGFDNPDNDPRGPWKADPFQVGGWRPNQQYEITNPKTGVVYRPNPGSSWKNDYNNFQKLLADNRIVFGRTGEGGPQRKRFKWEAEERGKVAKTWWDDVETTTNGTVLVKKLFNNVAVFDNPKPVGLLIRMLQLGTSHDNSIVLDFFSGSSTTAHAIMQLNADDGGTRKYIMVQIDEEIDQDHLAYDEGYRYIPEIAKERIRRAGKKIKLEHPEAKDLDTGFRVFKCESSNYKEVMKAPKDYDQSQLEMYIDNIKEDRTDLDLLFDCMLRWGVELSLPLSSQKVDGCTIHNVNDGDLVACFDGHVTENVIDAIAALSPVRVVFRDNSFDEAAQKMNLFELFKQKCDWTDEEVRNNIRVI